MFLLGRYTGGSGLYFYRFGSSPLAPLHFEYFTLGRIFGSDAYIKRYKDGTYKLKCVSPEDAPFIYRYINGEEYQDNDFVFEYNHKLAKFMNTPKYEISYEKR